MVGPAKVIKADIEATNGVIHVIDTVLMPPAPLDQDPAGPVQGLAREVNESPSPGSRDSSP